MFIINLLAAVSAAASPLLVWAAVKFFESGLADNGTQTLGWRCSAERCRCWSGPSKRPQPAFMNEIQGRLRPALPPLLPAFAFRPCPARRRKAKARIIPFKVFPASKLTTNLVCL